MKTKAKYRMDFVVANIQQHKLYVPRYVMENAHILKNPEASLLNKYLNKYPGFKIEVFDYEPIALKVPYVSEAFCYNLVKNLIDKGA